MIFNVNNPASPRVAFPAIIAGLEAIVGENHVITDAAGMEGFLREPRDLFHGKALCVVRPGSTQEVAAVLKLCHETATPVVPQGGNTGLVGGQIPAAAAVARSCFRSTRMQALREIDLASNTMTVEAGMVLARCKRKPAARGGCFRLSLAAEGSCTIGGNLATNAGGTNVIAYGNARDLVLGLEVVLADGRILSDLSKLKKNNTGYDLKNLFIGSEGTLGVITAAVLKLFPKPRAVETAFIGLASPRAALDLLDLARDMAGGEITSFELIPRIGARFRSRAFRRRAGRPACQACLVCAARIELAKPGRARCPLARASSKRRARSISSRMRRSPPRSISGRISGSCASSCPTPSATKAARSSMTSAFRSLPSRRFSTRFRAP